MVVAWCLCKMHSKINLLKGMSWLYPMFCILWLWAWLSTNCFHNSIVLNLCSGEEVFYTLCRTSTQKIWYSVHNAYATFTKLTASWVYVLSACMFAPAKKPLWLQNTVVSLKTLYQSLQLWSFFDTVPVHENSHFLPKLIWF